MKEKDKELKQKIYKNSLSNISNYIDKFFEIDQETFPDNIKNELTKYPKSYLLIATYFFTRLEVNYLINLSEREKIEKIINEAIQLGNTKKLDLYNIALLQKSDEIINKYNWVGFNEFLSNPEAEINNSLLLIDYFVNSLDKYKYEKYKWVVDKHGLESSRNFIRYAEPVIEELFPNQTKDLFNLLSIKFREVIIRKCQDEFNNLDLGKEVFFEEDSMMAFIFYDRKNIKVINEYLSSRNISKGTAKPAFFNRLLYILCHSKLDGKKLIKTTKSYKTDYRKEIERVFDIKLKLDLDNISNKLIEKEFNYFKEKFKLILF